MSSKPTTSKIAPLTSSRYFAALFVALFHTAYASGFSLSPRLLQFLSMGGTSVTFFFVLSGYILSLVYLGRPVLDRRRFWIARFARVYPLFFVVLVLDTPQILLDRVSRYGWPVSVGKTSVNFVIEALMLHGWSPKFNAINFPSWSLSDEAFFYALFPIVGIFLWRTRTGVVVAIGAVLYLCTMAAGTFLHSLGLSDNYAYNFPLQRASEFVLGIVACKIHTYLLSSPKLALALRRAALPLCLMCAFLILVDCYFPPPLFKTLTDGILLVPVYMALILALASDPFVIGRVLSNRILVLLGEASFAFYLIHIPIWHVFEALQLVNNRVHYVSYLIVVTGLSVCSFLFFEAPVRVRILAYASKRDPEGLQLSSMAQ